MLKGSKGNLGGPHQGEAETMSDQNPPEHSACFFSSWLVLLYFSPSFTVLLYSLRGSKSKKVKIDRRLSTLRLLAYRSDKVKEELFLAQASVLPSALV